MCCNLANAPLSSMRFKRGESRQVGRYRPFTHRKRIISRAELRPSPDLSLLLAEVPVELECSREAILFRCVEMQHPMLKTQNVAMSQPTFLISCSASAPQFCIMLTSECAKAQLLCAIGMRMYLRADPNHRVWCNKKIIASTFKRKGISAPWLIFRCLNARNITGMSFLWLPPGQVSLFRVRVGVVHCASNMAVSPAEDSRPHISIPSHRFLLCHTSVPSTATITSGRKE